MRTSSTLCAIFLGAAFAAGQNTELLPFGDFNQWVTRDIKESAVIGGKWRKCYAIGPTRTIKGSEPYRRLGGTPWGSSNIMAKVVGITKVSNAVFPDDRAPGDKCAKLTTMMEHCKAIGLINIDVMVAGTIFLGQIIEPIRSTTSPYSKMENGIPFTKRPKAMSFDYKLEVPPTGEMTYSSGFGSKKSIPGVDNAEALVFLQRRWEDADGNLHAKRVGTGRERFNKSTDGWVNGHQCKIHYGDITKEPYYKTYMGLIPKEKSYYWPNSKGEMVPVVEEGWDDAGATPTHMIVMFSSGSGEPYTGTLGMTMWVDNVGMVY